MTFQQDALRNQQQSQTCTCNLCQYCGKPRVTAVSNQSLSSSLQQQAYSDWLNQHYAGNNVQLMRGYRYG